MIRLLLPILVVLASNTAFAAVEVIDCSSPNGEVKFRHYSYSVDGSLEDYWLINNSKFETASNQVVEEKTNETDLEVQQTDMSSLRIFTYKSKLTYTEDGTVKVLEAWLVCSSVYGI